MRDIKTRMQKILLGVQSVDVSLLPAGTILMAEDLTPSVTAGINPDNVAGIVTELEGAPPTRQSCPEPWKFRLS